jgi:hypothetical protein
MVAELEPADGEGQFIEARVGEQPREALEAPVKRLGRLRPGAGQLGGAQLRALQKRFQQMGEPDLLGLAPGRGAALDEA